MITLKIPGKPIAKARPRFARRGRFTVAYSDQETEEGLFLWEIKQQLQGHVPYLGPVKLRIICNFERPKSHFGTGKNSGIIKASAPEYHIKKPDCDNLEKFVCDLLNGLAWKDDSQIIKATTEKYYADVPGTFIYIYPVDINE